MDPVGGSDIFSFGTGTGSSFFTILIFEEHPAMTNKKRIPSNTMLSGRRAAQALAPRGGRVVDVQRRRLRRVVVE
jgi:hypothetical protein